MYHETCDQLMMAVWTCTDIRSVNHQQKLCCPFSFYRVASVWCRAKKSDMCQIFRFDTVCQETAESDAMKPLRKYMTKEAFDEFLAGKEKLFLPITIGVVSITDHNAATKITPFGYICEDVKEGWEIEPVGAAIVKRIFSMAVEGKNTGEIARVLNADSTPTPGQLIGAPYKVKEEFIEWDGHMVRRILDNETYTGVLIQGKVQTLVPGKKMKKAGTKTYRHEGHHPVIVSHEAWEKVQKEGKPITQYKVTDWPLKGRVRCAVCNRALSRSANGMIRCKRKDCGVEISEEKLNGIVLGQIKEKRRELAAVKYEEVDTTTEKERIRELRIQQMNEYEKYVNGEITPDAFTERRVKIRTEINELLAFVEQAEAENKRQTEESIRNKWFLDHSKGDLSTDMVKDMIEEVLVGDEVEVQFC